MARSPRDNAAILARRNEIAREQGFSGYGQMRHYRQEARMALRDHGLDLGRSRADIAAVDSVAVLIRDARVTGTTNLSQQDLYDRVERVFEDRGVPIFDEGGHDEVWQVIRAFYPKKGR